MSSWSREFSKAVQRLNSTPALSPACWLAASRQRRLPKSTVCTSAPASVIVERALRAILKSHARNNLRREVVKLFSDGQHHLLRQIFGHSSSTPSGSEESKELWCKRL